MTRKSVASSQGQSQRRPQIQLHFFARAIAEGQGLVPVEILQLIGFPKE